MVESLSIMVDNGRTSEELRCFFGEAEPWSDSAIGTRLATRMWSGCANAAEAICVERRGGRGRKRMRDEA
nr:hypothetical protein Iba_chr05cCG0210 [Ipomoea batatas]